MYQNTVIYNEVHIISGTDSHAFQSVPFSRSQCEQRICIFIIVFYVSAMLTGTERGRNGSVIESNANMLQVAANGRITMGKMINKANVQLRHVADRSATRCSFDGRSPESDRHQCGWWWNLKVYVISLLIEMNYVSPFSICHKYLRQKQFYVRDYYNLQMQITY